MIEAVDVHKSYGAIRVLEAFSLRVEEGDSTSIYGRSGSGKTTLLKILASFIAPDKGTVYVEGRDVSKLREGGLARLRGEVVGFSFQEPLLLPYLSALENVVWPAYVTRHSPSNLRARAVRLLERLGLQDRLDHKPRMLSVGEKKRVDIARALLRQPKVVMADEPTSNLDSETATLVLDLLQGSKDETTTVVFTTTSQEAARLSEKRIELGPT